MRICMAVPYDLAEEGGVKRHAVQLSASLRKLGDEVDIIGPITDEAKLGDHMIGFRGVVNIPANGSDNWLGLFASPRKVFRLFEQRDYDVLHVHEPLQPALNYYALWCAGRAARVATFHGYMEHEGAGLRRARKLTGAIAFPGYDRGIAVSPAAAEYAAVSFPKPLAILPNGIRVELYAPGGPPVAGRPVKLLFVGHWRDERKGLPYLLDACKLLDARGVAWTLDVVGDGGPRAKVELPGVTYHGAITSEQRVAAMHAAADIFVSPAMGGESFGIVLLEAMASARAIVCSDLAGFRHAVGAGPECGARLVPPGDVAALADAIAALAADPDERARLGAKNRERVWMFDWERLVAAVRGEYLAALAARGADVAAHSVTRAHSAAV